MRDDEADARDWAADQRDMTANMDAWLRHDANGTDPKARQAASDDRLHSKGDRDSSAADRTTLAEDDDYEQEGG